MQSNLFQTHGKTKHIKKEFDGFSVILLWPYDPVSRIIERLKKPWVETLFQTDFSSTQFFFIIICFVDRTFQ